MGAKCNNGGLTARQLEIVRLRVSGIPFKEIAWRLHISVKTVEYHWARTQRATGNWDVALMVLWAIGAGIIECPRVKREVSNVNQ